jgi:prepilin-type N-terminal cleavage/methylation domain-containing protein
MPKRHSNLAGFTLIELILVLLILTIMVAIAAPSLRGFGIGRRSNEVATQIVSLANWAHSQSVSEGKVYRLSFDLPGRAFAVQVQETGEFKVAHNEYGDTIYLPDGMTIRFERDTLPAPTGNQSQTTDATYVDFRPDGRTDPARVFLTDKLGNQIEIACISATELFHVLKPGEVDHY